MAENNLKVIILDQGIITRTIENVHLIRIRSKKYGLLIMKDYCPVIGEIDGSVLIEADTSLKYSKMKGFYSVAHNVFHLIIRENSNA